MSKPDERRMEWGWANDPGHAYFQEDHDTAHRGKFWTGLLDRYPIKTALEVGCGTGVNLAYFNGAKATGIDINEPALERVPEGIETHLASATDLPFQDKSFDLVFTSGVLLHASPTQLPLQMAEIVRCAKRYVLALEYGPPEMVRVWRWMPDGGIWHRDYGDIYQREYGLKLLETGDINEGTWTGVTWWMFER